MLVNGFKAEYGQASGGVVNVITRSGTNQVRGCGLLLFQDEGSRGRAARTRIGRCRRIRSSASSTAPPSAGRSLRTACTSSRTYERDDRDSASVTTVHAADRRSRISRRRRVQFLNPHGIDLALFGVGGTQRLVRPEFVDVHKATGARRPAGQRESVLHAALPARLEAISRRAIERHAATTTTAAAPTCKTNYVNLNHKWVLGANKLNEAYVQYGNHHEQINAIFTTFPTVQVSGAFDLGSTTSFNPVNNHVVALQQQFHVDARRHAHRRARAQGRRAAQGPAVRQLLRFELPRHLHVSRTRRRSSPARRRASPQNQGDSQLKRPNETYGFFLQDDWRPAREPDAESRPALRLRDRQNAGADRRQRRAGPRHQRRQEQPLAAPRFRVVPERRHAPGHLRRHRPLLRPGDPQHHRQRALHAAEGDRRPDRQPRRCPDPVPWRRDRRADAERLDHRSRTGDAAQLELAGRLPSRADAQRRSRRRALSTTAATTTSASSTATPANPAPRPRPAATRRRPDPKFVNKSLYTNYGEIRYKGLLVDVKKRFSHNVPGRHRLYPVEDGEQLVQLRQRCCRFRRSSNLSWGPDTEDRRHRVEGHAEVNLPLGVQFGTIVDFRTEAPLDVLANGRDLNGDGITGDWVNESLCMPRTGVVACPGFNYSRNSVRELSTEDANRLRTLFGPVGRLLRSPTTRSSSTSTPRCRSASRSDDMACE